jgi:hypothetical protein
VLQVLPLADDVAFYQHRLLFMLQQVLHDAPNPAAWS